MHVRNKNKFLFTVNHGAQDDNHDEMVLEESPNSIHKTPMSIHKIDVSVKKTPTSMQQTSISMHRVSTNVPTKPSSRHHTKPQNTIRFEV